MPQSFSSFVVFVLFTRGFVELTFFRSFLCNSLIFSCFCSLSSVLPLMTFGCGSKLTKGGSLNGFDPMMNSYGSVYMCGPQTAAERSSEN